MHTGRIRHVILDWSGTLVDDLDPVLWSTNHVLAACGAPSLTREEFRAQFCLPVRKFYAGRLPDVPMARLEALFLAAHPGHTHAIRLLPHARDFLEFCVAAGIGTYIASTVDPDTYHTHMARLDAARYITRPYLGIEDKTVTIHRILAENALAPAETLFVGDMEHDIEAGRAGQLRTCAVLTGYNDAPRLRAMAPDYVCAHLGELQALLTAQPAPRTPLSVPLRQRHAQ